MAYALMRRGDQLPAVGTLQCLLNRAGASLTADGIYGPRTKAAVESFQRSHPGLLVDGVVGKNTWPKLVEGTRDLNIVDCIDVFDRSLFDLEYRDIRRVGGNPLTIGGMSNGVEQIVTDILRSVPRGSVFLLRFHGHGLPGQIGISDGHGGFPGENYSGIHPGNLSEIRPILARLRPIFGPHGCVQFMHCQTGAGATGRAVLGTMADILRVPATAAIRTQYGGGTTTFRFEGPTSTAIPGGSSLQAWCRALPPIPAVSYA